MPDDDRPFGGAELDDHALQLFGADKHSRGGKLGDVFDAYMLRHGHEGVYGDPIFNDPIWIFDDQLPEPGVVPSNIYTSAADHGALFLNQIRQGAKTGLVCDERLLLTPDPDFCPDFGLAPSLELTEYIVENQKMIDRGERSGWELLERLELHHKAWFRHGALFLPSFDNRGRPVDLPDDAKPILFKQALELLTDVSIFPLLLGLASIAMAARVPRDGMGGRTLLPIDTWGDGTIRIDFVRNLLFVPTYDQAKPWKARLEDIRLLNRALYPEWDLGQEITDPIPERPGRDGEDVEAGRTQRRAAARTPEQDAAEPNYPGQGEDAAPHRTLETKIIDEYEKIFGEKNPPKTYVGYAKLIKGRIPYDGEVSNIERRLRMLRKDRKIESIK